MKSIHDEIFPKLYCGLWGSYHFKINESLSRVVNDRPHRPVVAGIVEALSNGAGDGMSLDAYVSRYMIAVEVDAQPRRLRRTWSMDSNGWDMIINEGGDGH